MAGLTLALNSFSEITSALAAFFVTDPMKGVNIDRGFSVDETSQVNIYDEEADYGYNIKARLDSGIDVNYTVRIWSASSTLCTQASPCYLGTADQVVYVNTSDSAMKDNTSTGGTKGDVVDFAVWIHAGMGLVPGTHDIDIIFTKERRDGTMQTFDAVTCSSMPVYRTVSPPAGSEVKLVDVRDGKQYLIRKLADNNCWMVDNLALQPMVGSMMLDSDNSDMASGNYELMAGDVYPPTNAATYCAGLDTNIYPHQCGMYYSWTTVTTDSTLATGVAPDSICPKSWRLPVTGEYVALQTALGWGNNGNNVINSPWRGLLGRGVGVTDSGANGHYWTATALSATNSYSLGFYVSTTNPVYPSGNRPKTNALSVRCLAR